jgi:hypothetical protein
MNDIPKPWQIEYYKKASPPGTRIELGRQMSGEDSFRRITEEPIMPTTPAKQKKKDRGRDR